MMTFVLIIQFLSAIMMIVLVLLQQGKGADAGASMAGGAGSIFGSSGSGNFLSRLTAICTAIFFIASIGLAVLAKKESKYSLSLNRPVATETHTLAVATTTEKTSTTTN